MSPDKAGKVLVGEKQLYQPHGSSSRRAQDCREVQNENKQRKKKKETHFDEELSIFSVELLHDGGRVQLDWQSSLDSSEDG